jgi:HAMP domain-containing protein
MALSSGNAAVDTIKARINARLSSIGAVERNVAELQEQAGEMAAQIPAWRAEIAELEAALEKLARYD